MERRASSPGLNYTQGTNKGAPWQTAKRYKPK
jgi:hypothetical protein